MEQLSKYRITLPDSKINPDYDKYYDELLKKGGTSCYTVAIESLLKEYPKIIPSFEL